MTRAVDGILNSRNKRTEILINHVKQRERNIHVVAFFSQVSTHSDFTVYLNISYICRAVIDSNNLVISIIINMHFKHQYFGRTLWQKLKSKSLHIKERKHFVLGLFKGIVSFQSYGNETIEKNILKVYFF